MPTRPRTYLPYLIGCPIAAFVYLAGLVLLRASNFGWNPHPNPWIAGAIKAIFLVFYKPLDIVLTFIPGRALAGGLPAVAAAGAAWGALFIWLFRLGRRHGVFGAATRAP